MSQDLPPVNLTLQEMVPDTVTEGHDPQQWCLPPLHYNSTQAAGGGYDLYLVTRGRKVGIWRDWTVAQSMVSGFPNSAHKGHRTYDACKEEWQKHCLLGVHPHPPAPAIDPQPAPQPAPTPHLPPTPPARLATGVTAPPSRSAAASTISSPSSITSSAASAPDSPTSSAHTERSLSAPAAAPRRGVVARPRYYAVLGSGEVFSTRSSAKLKFDTLVAEGADPQLLSTADFDEALEYAEGVIIN